MNGILTKLDTPSACLVGFASWTGALVIGIGAYRVSNIIKGNAKITGFTFGEHQGPQWYLRLNRAHLNCIENLPLFAAVVIAGKLNNVSSPTLDLLSKLYLGARIGQSIAHISSGRGAVINIRFAFFIAQYVCLGMMIKQYL